MAVMLMQKKAASKSNNCRKI